MVTKVLGIVALLAFPMSVSLWHKSHNDPVQYRWDASARKSMRLYLKDGVFGLRVLSMPTKTAIRSEFRSPLSISAIPTEHAVMLSSRRNGVFRITWLIFPLWLSSLLLAGLATIPFLRGPVTRTWRRRHGRCVECGYDLRGCKSRRCPECGTKFS